MCFYLQKVRSVEILQMKAEFLRDENNNIWFVNASEIHIRRCTSKVGLQELDSIINEEKIKRVKAAQLSTI